MRFPLFILPGPDLIMENAAFLHAYLKQAREHSSHSSFAAMKLLIVENNENMRRVIRSVVGELAEVYECNDGRDALAFYSQCRPDWVFMDVKMEGLNGIAATREIKAAFPDARIVIVTNYDDAHLREAARYAGANDYVLKENLLLLRRIITAG